MLIGFPRIGEPIEDGFQSTREKQKEGIVIELRMIVDATTKHANSNNNGEVLPATRSVQYHVLCT